MGKDLYCEQCGKFPDRITETYLEPIVEVREWNGDCYELVESNISQAEYEQRCRECNSRLV